ncbi:HlyD family efflux transporter periplasmic adaptor subunit [Acinetobacter puyangensis]|uniref:HlyD family secretion protein n=1 Tax=Acinetobacter puyangensis TaxID=1096779 RepID=A0A240EBW8_9GAMM|nr:HlyD family efflux transporter periplasmic adaptor subunit [Acinetobacter puyangensis]SNX46208.1 HlyD family secretion protein [Acinetobacter puyangensis]
MKRKKIVLIVAAIVVLLAAYIAWQYFNTPDTEGLVSGNGRIEATEIDIASKLSGQLEDIYVNEGDFVEAGQLLAKVKISALEAQLREAEAQLQQAKDAIVTADAQVAMRQSDKLASLAVVDQRQTELQAAQKRLARTEILVKDNAVSKQQLDDERSTVQSAIAAISAAKAQVANAEASIAAAKAQVTGAKSNVEAVQATIERIQSDIDDSQLKSPLKARVQYRVAQPGEMIAAGGKVMNLIDLSDVYMTFFLPETVAGRVALGTEVRILLDIAPNIAIPARVSNVADTAQFTPKTVETESERQKLMFKVKARIDSDLLTKNIKQVKTGLPGVAWIKLDPEQAWPQQLSKKAE